MTKKSSKTPWPTQKAMEQVYTKNLWGGNPFEFYSGDGSHLEKFVSPYIEVISQLLQSFNKPISVCDLGCGDFNIGKQLAPFTKEYIGIDIVGPLIEHLKKMYQTPHISFLCRDIAQDELPNSDVVLLRQVLQHLSNEEIKHIVKKLSQYKHLIITEHIPQGTFTPNLDILSGQGIRIKKQSGVNLLETPFNLSVQSQQQLLSIPLEPGNGKIVTTYFKL